MSERRAVPTLHPCDHEVPEGWTTIWIGRRERHDLAPDTCGIPVILQVGLYTAHDLRLSIPDRLAPLYRRVGAIVGPNYLVGEVLLVVAYLTRGLTAEGLRVLLDSGDGTVCAVAKHLAG